MKDKHALLFESNQMKQKDKKVNDYVFNNKIVTHPDFVVHRSTIFMQKWGILLMEKEKSQLDDDGNKEVIMALGAIKQSVKTIQFF